MRDTAVLSRSRRTGGVDEAMGLGHQLGEGGDVSAVDRLIERKHNPNGVSHAPFGHVSEYRVRYRADSPSDTAGLMVVLASIVTAGVV